MCLDHFAATEADCCTATGPSGLAAGFGSVDGSVLQPGQRQEPSQL